MSDKIEIPASTKWEVGLSLASFVMIATSLGIMFFLSGGSFDIESASPFMKVVIIGAVIGTILAVASAVFNIVILFIAAVGSLAFAGGMILWEMLFGKGK